MKKMIIILHETLQNLFLNTATSDRLHEAKNEYVKTTIKGKAKAKKAQKIIEHTVSYKIGLAANRFK